VWQLIAPTRIVILQNMVKKIIDFKAIRQVTRVPVHHFWTTNWNTFYSLNSVVMVFMPEASIESRRSHSGSCLGC
jgi:hypothetical protein